MMTESCWSTTSTSIKIFKRKTNERHFNFMLKFSTSFSFGLVWCLCVYLVCIYATINGIDNDDKVNSKRRMYNNMINCLKQRKGENALHRVYQHGKRKVFILTTTEIWMMQNKWIMKYSREKNQYRKKIVNILHTKSRRLLGVDSCKYCGNMIIFWLR